MWSSVGEVLCVGCFDFCVKVGCKRFFMVVYVGEIWWYDGG